MKLAFPRSILTLGIAFGSIFLMPTQASAGTTELRAIATQLNGGTLPPGANPTKPTPAELIAFIRTKTSLEIANAVVALTQLKPTAAAAYAGEALKQADEADFGTVLGQQLNANQGTLTGIYGTPVTKAKFIGTASRLAATGTGAFAEWVDEFARQLTATNQEAYDAAKIAAKSKTAAGLIVASRTLDPSIDTLAELTDLAQKALLPKSTTTGGQGLTAAAQEVARYVGDAVATADVDQFARDLTATTITVGVKQQQPLLARLALIVTGTVTSNPREAQEIVSGMFGNVNLSAPDTVYLATVKNTAALTKNLGLVADAEEVSQLAFEFGQRVGDVNPTTKKIVGIAQKSVTVIAKNLVTGLATRATGVGAENAVRNSRTNRIDEIGEVGAYLLAGIKDLPDFQNIDPKTGLQYAAASKGEKAAAARASALVTGIIKTIIAASAKVHRDVAALPPAKGTIVKDATFQQTVADDIAGSVAQTVRSLQGTISTAAFNAITTALTATNAGLKIAGKTLASVVQAALASGLNGTPAPNGGQAPFHIYEDGTDARLAQGPFPGIGGVTEPETDIRSR